MNPLAGLRLVLFDNPLERPQNEFPRRTTELARDIMDLAVQLDRDIEGRTYSLPFHGVSIVRLT
jgi:hypothetical protein